MSDRVELTDAEREALLFGFGIRFYENADHTRFAQGVAVVESIVAARVAALTAERDRLRVDTNINADEVERQRGLLDLARAELAAANARCAELRGEHGGGSFWSQAEWSDWSNRLASFLPEEYDGDEAQEAIIERALTDLVAERDALRARCAELETGIAKLRDGMHEFMRGNWPASPTPVEVYSALAALTPEGTE